MSNVSKIPVNGFKWKKNSKFNEDFIKNYDEKSNKGCILGVDVEYPKRLHNLHSDLPFSPEIMKIKNAASLLVICVTKKLYCSYKSFKTSVKSWISF